MKNADNVVQFLVTLVVNFWKIWPSVNVTNMLLEIQENAFRCFRFVDTTVQKIIVCRIWSLTVNQSKRKSVKVDTAIEFFDRL